MYRFFKCNVLGGFRLSDLNKNIRQGEYFHIESSFCETSRAVRAALQNKWMTEITEKEASQFLSVPRVTVGAVQTTEVGPKKSVINAGQVASPNVQVTNKSLESRQAERSIKNKQPAQKQKEEDKAVLPNFSEAEKMMKTRQADIMTKGPDEVLKSPVEAKRVSSTKQDEFVKDLAKEIADNSLLSTPNFDEKKEAAKIEVGQEIEKRMRRRRKTLETSEVAA